MSVRFGSVRDFFERLGRPEDRIILALLAIVAGYAIWGAWLGWRRGRKSK